ncbi:MAG TPA: sugar transferase [Longimicrobiales bacterium]
MLRRVVDVVCALILLLITAPLLAAGALAVLIGSGRPIFFGHTRVGRGGKLFRCWKLRTMTPCAERVLQHAPALRQRYIENGFKLGNGEDPRITREGRWLRRSYVDEIPQFFNVLSGTMSLIGPRPVVLEELALYGDGVEELLQWRPGIFGEWTSRGRRRPDYPERARLELEFIRNRSIRRDLMVLLRSIPVVLRGQDGR